MVNIRRAGPEALLLEVDAPHAWYAELAAARDRGDLRCDDIVPGAATLLLIGVDPSAPALHDLLAATSLNIAQPVAAGHPGPSMEIPVRWDGPDLDEVALIWGCDPAQVLRDTVFTVSFGGFAPGFAYLTGLAEKWQLPRRPAPRPSVPAGSVAVAGAYAGIYPRSTPGGWQLLGSTDAVLFDVDREPPALLLPGMTVRMIDA